jgi:hypothetical protein
LKPETKKRDLFKIFLAIPFLIVQFLNMDNEKIKKLVSELAGDFKPSVLKIEARIATTRNHYGDYMALLSSIAKTENHARLFALAMIEAGANRQGVNDAMRVLGYV